MKTANQAGIYAELPARLAHLASRLSADPWNTPISHGRVHVIEDDNERQIERLDVARVVATTVNSVFALGGLGHERLGQDS